VKDAVVRKATINVGHLKLNYHDFALAHNYDSATKPKLYQLTRIYHQLKYTANNHKLPTSVSVPEKTSHWQNWHPPTLPLKRKFNATNP
jgi:hypothetical protein